MGGSRRWQVLAIETSLMPQIDHKHGDRPIFETIAILEYLTALYDPEGRISYKLDKQPDLWTEQQSWLAWAQGGLGASALASCTLTSGRADAGVRCDPVGSADPRSQSNHCPQLRPLSSADQRSLPLRAGEVRLSLCCSADATGSRTASSAVRRNASKVLSDSRRRR